MYPPMVERAEGGAYLSRALHAFALAAVEKVHYDLFEKAAAAVCAAGTDLGEVEVHVCPVCGHTVIGPVECGCGASRPLRRRRLTLRHSYAPGSPRPRRQTRSTAKVEVSLPQRPLSSRRRSGSRDRKRNQGRQNDPVG